MTKDEVLKLALEALEMFCEHGAILRPIETRDAIKEALAQPEQEPVAYVKTVIEALYENSDPVSVEAAELLERITTPPQRKPLTDEEIRSIWNDGDCYEEIAFARAIEAAHGITEEKNT